MVEFTFVTDEALRASLESDYAELASAMNGSAWKAVHVLAGSIIEALLVDYLLAADYQARTRQDPLRMELAPLIAACRAEGALTERTEQLSTVVRGYRNLIHPGRVVRLNEKVNQSTAKIAEGLVELIVEEVAAKRKETYGYTAEQLIAKVEQDHSALAIITDLLREMRVLELERLLLKVLPQHYFLVEVLADEQSLSARLTVLSRCFRSAFDMAPDEVKTKATKHVVTILREESQSMVFAYEASFFRCNDLKHLTADEARLVKKHLLSRPSMDRSIDLWDFLRLIDGMGRFLDAEEGRVLARGIAQLASREPLDKLRTGSNTLNAFGLEYISMPKEAVEAFRKAMGRLLENWREFGDSVRADIVALILIPEIPF